jgi:hypothetical protein
MTAEQGTAERLSSAADGRRCRDAGRLVDRDARLTAVRRRVAVDRRAAEAATQPVLRRRIVRRIAWRMIRVVPAGSSGPLAESSLLPQPVTTTAAAIKPVANAQRMCAYGDAPAVATGPMTQRNTLRP